MQKLFPWIITIAALLISSAAASIITDSIAPSAELYGFARVIFAAIPGMFVSFIHDRSRKRKPNVWKNLLSGVGASVLVAVERDLLKLPLTLSLEFALAGVAGFLNGEFVFGWAAQKLGLKGGDARD